MPSIIAPGKSTASLKGNCFACGYTYNPNVPNHRSACWYEFRIKFLITSKPLRGVGALLQMMPFMFCDAKYANLVGLPLNLQSKLWKGILLEYDIMRATMYQLGWYTWFRWWELFTVFLNKKLIDLLYLLSLVYTSVARNFGETGTVHSLLSHTLFNRSHCIGKFLPKRVLSRTVWNTSTLFCYGP